MLDQGNHNAKPVTIKVRPFQVMPLDGPQPAPVPLSGQRKSEEENTNMARINPQPDNNKKVDLVTSETVPVIGAVPASVARNMTTDAQTKHWIPKHINMRLCRWYVPRPNPANPSDPICFCNYAMSKHTHEATTKHRENPEVKKWKPDEAHTEPVPTDAYGDVEFIGYGKRVSKYVRLDHNTPMDVVLELMLGQWQLDPPKLLISVTGGAKNFHMQPRLSEVFRRGLMAAASSTGAWIITGGMHAGVMKLVGQAVADWTVANGYKTKVTAIGIAPWGCVNNKESLIDSQERGAQYRLEKPRLIKHSPIDMNHSHFLFLDNGTQQIYATEIAFRAQLEKAVNTMGTDAGGEKIEVPVVCVVVEGGPGTLETVMRALQSGTPAVIIEGSRRAADILAYAYWNSHEVEVQATDQFGKKVQKMVPVFDDGLWKKVKEMIFGEFGDRDIDSRLNWVKECFQYRHNMTIFRLDGEGTKSIDVAILQALLKANKEHVTDQLKLALAWNRIDVAQSDIFTDDKRWEKGELDDSMYMALVKNRVDFVKLLLENGLSLKDFLTVRNLLRLYNDIPENSMLYSLLPPNKKDEFTSLEDIGRVIQSLIGDYYQPSFLRDPRYKDLNVGLIMRGQASRALSRISICNGEDVTDLFGKLQYESPNQNSVVKGVTKIVCFDDKTGEHYVVHDFNEPAQELFVWAVLLNRFEMAKVFWKEGKESVTAALMAEKMITSMLNRTEDTELVKTLEKALEDFQELSIGVLSECHTADERKAGMLLVRRNDSFGETTAMQLAVSADNKEFISHAACQTLLNAIWRGRMTQDLSLWRLAVCIIFPPFVYLLISFRSDVRDELLSESKKEREIKRSKTKSLKIKDLEMAEMASITSKSMLIDEHRRPYTPAPKDGGLSCIGKLVSFYNAPLVTFIYNCLSYLVFLFLYSCMILTDFNLELSVLEIIIIVWVFTLTTEEIRQVVMDESFSLSLKVVNYFSDPWNIVDVVCILSYIVGLILRLVPFSLCEDCFFASRIVLALNLMTFYFRILHMFSVHKELGPKLVMIGRMMIDLMYFVVILFVFIVAYGVASQAILYPNTPGSFQLINDILRKPYWQMYGELFLEELEGEVDCSNNATVIAAGTLPRCPVESWVVPILLGVYILITNVLMLNLLIAMFSYTFENVQTNTDAVWKIQRHDIVKEYYERPPITPPFIIIAHIFFICRKLGNSCGCRSLSENNPFSIELTKEELTELILWENLNQDDYMRSAQMQKATQLHNQVATTHDMVVTIMSKVEEVAESNFMIGGSHANTSSSSTQSKLPPALDERMTYLEEQMKRTSQALDWIIKSMVENKIGAKEGAPKLPDIDQMKKEALNKKKALEEKEKEQVKEMLKRQLDLHVKSRTKLYPSPTTVIYRFPVPDDRVLWDNVWPDYDPTTFTDKTVLDRPSWADIDLLSYDILARPMMKFNEMDEENGVDRRSFTGKYIVNGGLPINPKGRTGLNGRGMLGRWGPNLAGDPIVTRWAKNSSGEFVKQDGKRVLEFVSVQRLDAKQWAIPGGLLQLGQTVDKALKADFTEEALGDLPDPVNREQMKVKLNKLFQDGAQVYKGYSDDPRNTDNAWVETTAVNYHDEKGLTNSLMLRAGGSAEMVRWMKISADESLYAAHVAILQKVTIRLDAAF